MTDSEVLKFIHDRLIYSHSENPRYDYMVRLRDIVTVLESQELCEKEGLNLKVVSPPQVPLYDKDTVDSIITSLCNENKRLKDLLLSKGNG